MATSARDLWWESCFSNSTVIASALARKTQRRWSWSWRAGTSTKRAISLFFALMHRLEKNETAAESPVHSWLPLTMTGSAMFQLGKQELQIGTRRKLRLK